MNNARQVEPVTFDLRSSDGHEWSVSACIPLQPVSSLFWLPALGVAARHYLPFAQSLAQRGIAVFLHELRGNGTSNLRASREQDWGYRELLELDLPATEAAIGKTITPEVTRIIGGHSLGGQLACCRLAMQPSAAGSLWLVASGSPYWRAFPAPLRYALPLAYRFLPWLADRCGVLPGRRIGFGGQEARGLIHDWAGSAISGRYAADGLDIDLEASLASLTPEVRAVVLTDDWLAPVSSLQYLLSKMPQAHVEIASLEAKDAKVPANHFAWMKQPEVIADKLVDRQRSALSGHLARG